MAYTLTYELIDDGTAYKVSGYTGQPINVVIPSEYGGLPVTGIGSGVFEECFSLTSVVIPDSVIMLGDYAFFECFDLTSVVIGNGVIFIGISAFSSCSSLTSVAIPDSVTTIGNSAFSGCSGLTSIEISDGVTSIGTGAFSNCRSLTQITLLAKTPSNLASSSFYGISADAKFYCYSSAVDAYKAATNWNAFADKFIADDMRLYFTMNARAQKKYFASKEWVNAQNFGGSGSIDTSNLISWDREDRYIYDLGLGSWTTGSTTWYEDEECADNTASQYVRISPLGPDYSYDPSSNFYITARYSENDFIGLNPWGIYMHQKEQDAAIFTTRGITVWYDDPDSTNEAEAYTFSFPIGVNHDSGSYMLATEEYVNNKLSRVPKIYATESGTATVGTLRIYTDSNGYLHIKTS